MEEYFMNGSRRPIKDDRTLEERRRDLKAEAAYLHDIGKVSRNPKYEGGRKNHE